MLRFDEESLRRLMREDRLPGLRPDVLARTKLMMRRELQAMTAAIAPAPEPVRTGQAGPVLLLSAFSLLVAFGMFFTATVGTLTWLLLPELMSGLFKYTLVGGSCCGICLLVGLVLVIAFKACQAQRPALQRA